MNRYKDWQVFKFKGKKFLALIEHDGNTHIKGPQFANYGAFMSIESFKRMYANEGENLLLEGAVLL